MRSFSLRLIAATVICLSIGSTTARAETNLRISPLSLLLGLVGAEADFGISENWTLGPTFYYLNRSSDDFDVSATSLGIRGNYYFDRAVFTQGWYIGPSVSFLSVKVKDNSGTFNDSASASGTALTGIFGYQWTWESFNINLGAGPVAYSLGKIRVKDSNGNEDTYSTYSNVGLSIEFNLGWKF